MKILVVDDSKLIRALLRNILERELRSQIEEASSGSEAVQKTAEAEYDLVILDMFLPDTIGVNIIKQIIKLERGWLPVIIITSATDKRYLKEALEKGAIDYIRKPFDEVELTARVKAALRTKKLYDRLREMNQKLLEMSITDELTKLYNRRHAMTSLEMEFKKSKRYKTPMSVIISDLDHFKSINDAYGHLAGDEVLKKAASLIRENIREADIAGRYGGEEFMIILPNTSLDGAITTAERLRSKISQSQILVPGNGKVITITMSFGICSYPEETIRDKEDMIKLADEALYISKKKGRNKTTFYSRGVFLSIPTEGGKK
ncbi:MAG: diguanylate cyclase [Synergistetes bacterium]|nr:diguanylate cyclase [Synergistota bacterium]